MKTLHNPPDKQSIIDRLIKIEPSTPALWGKMNAGQMICHLSDQLRVALGEIPTDPVGNFLTHTLLKWLSLYVIPTPKGKIQTVKEMLCTVPKEFQNDRDSAINIINKFSGQDIGFKWAPHPFFGSLTHKEWGILAYLHIDHHLKQFEV